MLNQKIEMLTTIENCIRNIIKYLFNKCSKESFCPGALTVEEFVVIFKNS